MTRGEGVENCLKRHNWEQSKLQSVLHFDLTSPFSYNKKLFRLKIFFNSPFNNKVFHFPPVYIKLSPFEAKKIDKLNRKFPQKEKPNKKVSLKKSNDIRKTEMTFFQHVNCKTKLLTVLCIYVPTFWWFFIFHCLNINKTILFYSFIISVIFFRSIFSN